MSPAFFTKKQKTQMRKRRRKHKLLTNDDDADGGISQQVYPPTKRLRQDKTSEGTLSQQQQPKTITIPANLSGKASRKFRKDERRRTRAAGGEESLLTFVLEGQEDDGKPDEQMHIRKKKKSFPRINELLQQQKEQERLEQEQEKRRAAEARIPDEIKSRYIALDCEMVGIGANGKQSALARVSMVDWNLETVLDTFVQVPSKVTDFRTFVSGVRAADLKNAMDVVLCRQKVSDLLRNKILVGHALKNDLQALLLQHPKHDIRDTAKYRPFQRSSGPNGGKWRPRKLRDLVKEHVGKSIQVEGESHDSVEDAQATMELFHRVREVWEKELEAKQKKKSRKGKK